VVRGAAERPDHGEAMVTGAEEERGGGAGGLRGDAGLGLGFWPQGLPFCRAAGSISAYGPRKRSSPRISGRALRAGEERGRGKTALASGVGGSEGERRERGRAGGEAGADMRDPGGSGRKKGAARAGKGSGPT
jgi:hypothetical protein